MVGWNLNITVFAQGRSCLRAKYTKGDRLIFTFEGPHKNERSMMEIVRVCVWALLYLDPSTHPDVPLRTAKHPIADAALDASGPLRDA